jgi:hypothetical protein
MRRLAVAAVAGAVACLAAAVPAAPPAAGLGYGQWIRTVEGLDDVRAALVEDDGTITALLGAGGVVRVAADGARAQVVPGSPDGPVPAGVAMARSADGRLAVAGTIRVGDDRAALGGVLLVARDGATTGVPLLPDDVRSRPVGVAWDGQRLLVADGGTPRVIVCAPDGSVQGTWSVQAKVPAVLPTVLGGIAAANGVVAVTDVANNLVLLLSAADGSLQSQHGDRGAFPGMWQSPAGVAWDGAAFLVTDTLNHRVVRLDAVGKVLDQWGMHAVRPREGDGKIHYPVDAAASPDGRLVVVAEPFERRVQVFGHKLPPDPKKPGTTPLPGIDGVASHFSTSLAVDGKTLLVYEPESASALIFDLRTDPPIHVTTFGGPGTRAGQFGQVTALCVDDAANRLWLADPLRGVISEWTLLRDGTAPHFDPFMARLVREVPLAPMGAAASAKDAARAPGAGREPAAVWPVDLRRSVDGTLVLLDANGPRLIGLDASLAMLPDPVPLAAEVFVPGQCAPLGPLVGVTDPARRGIANALTPRAVQAASAQALRALQPLAGSVRPFGIAAIPGGPQGGPQAVVVSDPGADRLLVLDPATWAVRATCGSNGSKPGELWEPGAVAWSQALGRIVVVDHGNHRIQTFTPDGLWQSSFGIGRPYVRPKDPQATAPVVPEGKAPSAEGAADTRAQFPAPTKDADGWWHARSAGGAWDVAWRIEGPNGLPPVRDPFAILFRVTDAKTGAPFTGEWRVDAAMPQHGHGMNVAPVVKATAPGQYRAEGMLFHMPGYWELYFDAVDAGRLERTQGAVTLE